IFVSGGLDSSLVASLSAPAYARRGEPGAAFSMVLARGAGELDESVHVARLAAALGFSAHRTTMDPASIKARLADVTRAQEEPVAGIAVAGQFLTYSLAAEHGMKVILDGQGADELFAGYPRHQVTYLQQCARRREIGTLLAQIVALVVRD